MKSQNSSFSTSAVCSENVFKDIFNTHFKPLRNFLRYKFHDENQAEDIAQNAFVKLWENCRLLKVEQSKKFLYTTAIRMSLNQIKHEKVVSNFKLKQQPQTTSFDTPDLMIVGEELKEKLEKAIHSLPEKQRMVFLMNRFDHHSYTEIAALLDVSVKTVEKRMHLALIELRKVLFQH